MRPFRAERSASRTSATLAPRSLAGRLSDEPPDLPRGAGPVWVGGFAFAPGGGGTPEWSSFPPALLVLPELAIVRSGGRCLVTVSALLAGGEEAAEPLRRIGSRLAALARRELPMLDPHPTGEVAIRSVQPPERL